MHVAHDRAIEIHIARQVGCVARRECAVDIEAVPGKMIVFLRDVYLRARTHNVTKLHENKNSENEN